MKSFVKFLFILAVGLLANVCHADVIVLKNGSSMEVFNVDVAGKSIIYTLEQDENSAIYKISKDECFAIKIGDGELQILNSGQAQASVNDNNQPSDNKPTFVPAVPDYRNEEIINEINNGSLRHIEKQPDQNKFKEAEKLVWLLGVTEESVLSDDNVEIYFELNERDEIVGRNGEYFKIDDISYQPNWFIKIKNKTDNNIYIDVENSFRINMDGEASSFYGNLDVVHSSGKANGGSVNLGGITGALGIGGAVGTLANAVNLGGGNSSTTTVTEQRPKIITIPPHATGVMPFEQKLTPNKKHSYKIGEFKYAMPAPFVRSKDPVYGKKKELVDNSWEIPEWVEISFNDKFKNNTIKRIITYSTQPDFKTYSQLNVTLYPRAVFGVSENRVWSKYCPYSKLKVEKGNPLYVCLSYEKYSNN